MDLAARDSLLGKLASSLSPQQAEICEGLLTIAECHQLLNVIKPYCIWPVGRRLAPTVSLLNFTIAFGMFLGEIW